MGCTVCLPWRWLYPLECPYTHVCGMCLYRSCLFVQIVLFSSTKRRAHFGSLPAAVSIYTCVRRVPLQIALACTDRAVQQHKAPRTFWQFAPQRNQVRQQSAVGTVGVC